MTEPLHLLDLRVDPRALLRFGQAAHLEPPTLHTDGTYRLHAWLRALLGDTAPPVWAVVPDPSGSVRVLAYSWSDAAALMTQVVQADRVAQAALLVPVRSRPLPTWTPGQTVNFDLTTIPTVRRSGNHRERDPYLTEGSPDPTRTREMVYTAWLAQRLARISALEVSRLHLQHYTLVRAWRRTQHTSTHRDRIGQVVTHPAATFHGTLVIKDPVGMTALLAHGIGRHQAFGAGMLRLLPASPIALAL